MEVPKCFSKESSNGIKIKCGSNFHTCRKVYNLHVDLGAPMLFALLIGGFV